MKYVINYKLFMKLLFSSNYSNQNTYSICENKEVFIMTPLYPVAR